MRLRILMLGMLCTCLALGAAIDGKWTSEIKAGGKKGKKAGKDQTQRVTFDLKSQGDRLSGSVMAGARKRAQSMEIQNGKIEGNRFSFVTVRRSKKGEQKTEWRGTIEGDTLQGTRGREGARRGAQFTAKREV